MKTRMPILTALTLALTLMACQGNEDCDRFAQHLSDVLTKEKAAAGGSVTDEIKSKMIKKTSDSCVADPPTKEQLDCALKAETSEAIAACGETKK